MGYKMKSILELGQYEETQIIDPGETPYLAIFLSGRGGSVDDLMPKYTKGGFLTVPCVCHAIAPTAWYPAPHGPDNQQAAIEGMEKSLVELEEKIADIQKENGNIPNSMTAIIGFSAGAVMAIQLGLRSQQNAGTPEDGFGYMRGVFAVIVSHSGAILDIPKIDESNGKSPVFLLTHSEMDSVFSWKQRYLPMEKFLKESGQNVRTMTSKVGGHYPSNKDIEEVKKYLRMDLV
jgi:predicted esterase